MGPLRRNSIGEGCSSPPPDFWDRCIRSYCFILERPIRYGEPAGGGAGFQVVIRLHGRNPGANIFSLLMHSRIVWSRLVKIAHCGMVDFRGSTCSHAPFCGYCAITVLRLINFVGEIRSNDCSSSYSSELITLCSEFDIDLCHCGVIKSHVFSHFMQL